MKDDESVIVDDDEEAEWIQNYLLTNRKGYISTDNIKIVIEAQTEFLASKGIITKGDD